MLLTAKQVAELLNISDRAVRELSNPRTRSGDLRSNPLPSIRLSPRRIRFDREAVLAWFALHIPLHNSDSAVRQSA